MNDEAIIIELGKFYNLDINSNLFKNAILPRSCGGGYEFEQLAAYGDQIFDIHLVSYFIENGYKSKGEITKERQKIHKEEVIVKIAKILNIDKILHPISGVKIEDKDISECIESLLGANFKTNGIEDSKETVFRLVEIYDENQLFNSEFGSDNFQDSISALNHLYSSVGQMYSNDILLPIRIGGEDHDPMYQVETIVEFNQNEYRVTSQIFNSKDKARKNAALNLINQIFGSQTDVVLEKKKIEKVETFASHSLTDEKLIFEYFSMDMPMKLTKGSGEKILDWIQRKLKKPFSMIVLLSARLSTFQFTAWGCNIDAGELSLLTISFENKNYFSVGFASSKSQARKNAAKKLLDQTPLLTWLNQNYSKFEI